MTIKDIKDRLTKLELAIKTAMGKGAYSFYVLPAKDDALQADVRADTLVKIAEHRKAGGNFIVYEVV